jgi:chromatin remodeling complex protein RSC6
MPRKINAKNATNQKFKPKDEVVNNEVLNTETPSVSVDPSEVPAPAVVPAAAAAPAPVVVPTASVAAPAPAPTVAVDAPAPAPTDAEEPPALESASTNEPKKRKKKHIVQESILEDLDELVNFVDKEIQRLMMTTDKQKGSKFLRSIRKRAEHIKKNVENMSLRKKAVEFDSSKSGFLIKYRITDELAKFLGIDPKTKPSLSRSEVQSALCAYINLNSDEARETSLKWSHLNKNHRDLRDPNNKKIIVPDAALSKLLNYEGFKAQVLKGEIKKKNRKTGNEVVLTEPNLEYCYLMKLIQRHFVKN